MTMEEIKKGGLVLFGGAVAAKLGGMIFKFITMNRLPPELYGELAIFLVLFNWLLLLSTFNITIGLSKKISESRDSNYYKASLMGCGVLSVVIGIFVAVLSPLLSEFFSIGSPLIIAILGATMPLAVLFYIKMYHFRGLYKMNRSVYMDFFLIVSRIGFLLLLFHFGLNLSPYLSFLLSFLVIDAYMLIKGKFRVGIGMSEAAKYFKKIAFYSFPIFIAESFRFFGLGLDRLFLARVFGTASTGIYDVGVSLCMGYVIIATSFGNALLPSASKSEEEKDKLRKGLGKTLLYVLGLYVLYTLLLKIAGRPVIAFVNADYLPLFNFLDPLMLAYALTGIFTLLIFFLSGIKLQRYAAYASVVFVAVAIILNYLLVPTLKYMGAIYAVTASAIAALGVMAYPVARRLR